MIWKPDIPTNSQAAGQFPELRYFYHYNNQMFFANDVLIDGAEDFKAEDWLNFLR